MSSLEPMTVVLVLAIWSLVVAALWRLRTHSPLFLPTLALIVTALVGSFYPLASTLVEPSSWRNLDLLSPAIVLATQAQYVAFAAGLLLAIFLASQLRWLAPRAAEPSTAAGTRDLITGAALVAVGLALYAAYAQQVGFSALTDREDYALKYLLGRGLGPLQLGMPIMIVGCLWIEGSALPRTTRNLFLPIAAAIAIWSVAFISVRTNAVVLVLGYTSILARRRNFQLRSIRPWMVIAGVALYAALESFALLRGVYRGDFSEALGRLEAQGELVLAAAVGGSELSHPFITAGEVLREREAAELGGASLLDGVAACLPRGLYPDRPLYLSEQFVRSNYADLAARGGGTAFSLVAEAWLNFGSLVGPALFGCAIGLLLTWLEQRRDLRPDGLVARLLPYFVFYVAMQHRNEFGTLFKQAFMISLVVIPLALVGETLALAMRRGRIQPRAEGA
jgi:hypothetical protein